jgi:hypothetical protein
MRKPRCVLILLVLLGLCLCPVVPAEDVPETAYDESEALPYETTPLYLIGVPQASARAAKAELSGDFLNSLTKHGKCRRENDARSRCVPDSLTIINHSLRC